VDADQLMSNADLALYRVKSDGRRGFSFFKAEMNDRIQMRRSLEADLRKAFEKDELALSISRSSASRRRRSRASRR
jgi:predicted signal transduction protein with EAL and GGDEF domain